jgi:hypothetical protein
MLRRIISLAFAAALLPAVIAKAETAAPPVVLELFTSQGCYSYPPADSLLGELAKHENVVALGYHVTYWDRLGWLDPFGTKWGTERQYEYARSTGEGRVYTPQLVVDGAKDAVGSDERKVRALIQRAQATSKPAQPTLGWTKDGKLTVSLPDAPEAAGAEIWLIHFDEKRHTDILRGENGGKRLAYHKVARERASLGRYKGRAQTIEAAVKPSDTEWGVAVLVQSRGPGRICGAATILAH